MLVIFSFLYRRKDGLPGMCRRCHVHLYSKEFPSILPINLKFDFYIPVVEFLEVLREEKRSIMSH